jgi:autotransporter-associated beta strand protein
MMPFCHFCHVHAGRPARHVLRTLALVCFAFAANLSQATLSNWIGGGGNVNWSTAGNWDVTPVNSSTTDVFFAGINNTGTAGTPLNQDIAGTLTVNRLVFSAGAGAFFLGGNSIQFNGNNNELSQNSDSDQSIANSIDIDPGSNNQTYNITLDGNGTGLVTLSGGIHQGNGQRDYALTKNGNSIFVLSGASTYSAGTTVNFGELYINNTSGSGTGSGNVVVNGGTFGGSGTISGAAAFAAGSSLSPGALGAGTTAIFRTGNLTLNSGSIFVLDLNNPVAGSGYDQVRVTGTVNINGSILSLNPGGGVSLGDTFFILANNGVDPITGTFSQGATVTSGSYTFSINYMANFDGGAVANDISLTVISILPEPSTWVAGIVAFAAMAHQTGRFFRRRR